MPGFDIFSELESTRQCLQKIRIHLKCHVVVFNAKADNSVAVDKGLSMSMDYVMQSESCRKGDRKKEQDSKIDCTTESKKQSKAFRFECQGTVDFIIESMKVENNRSDRNLLRKPDHKRPSLLGNSPLDLLLQ